MNGAQLHLAINHVPVILSLIGLAVLVWGWLSKNPEIKKVALVLIVANAFSAGAAFLTGEPAEDVLRNTPSFSRHLIHEHEEAGEAALIVSIVAGVAALGTLLLAQKKPALSNYLMYATLILMVMTSIAFLKTAHEGGLIKHDEIRPPDLKTN